MTNAFPSVTGYVASIWNAAFASLTYANATLSTLGTTTELVLAEALGETLRNGRDSIDANQLGSAASSSFAILGPTLAVSSGLDPITLSFIQNRIQALQTFALALRTLQPVPVATPSAALAAGNPAIADPLLLEYFVGFLSETPPAGLTIANFSAQAQAEADAWTAYAAALIGLVSNQAIDEINYMGAASQEAATAISNVSLSIFTNLTTAWNQMVALPSLTRYSSSGANDPTSAFAQQAAVIRYLLGECLYQTYVLIVNIRQVVPSVVSTITVRNNDTLMAIAARALGDYTQWQTIAQINNLIPPYIAQVSGPGIAGWGQRIYLPTSSFSATTASDTTVTPAAYEATFLGTDFYYGSPINGDMLPWTGDILTISSYQNLAFSLGRRLQTTLGSLLYHNDFGSRIPPEIGNVTTSDTAGHLAAFAQSALASDARVAQVLSATATVLTSWAIVVQGTVLPKGLTGNAGVEVNATLSPVVAGLQ